MPFSGLVGMNPGGGMDIPSTIGGGSGAPGAGGKKPSNWWALAGAPLLAMLGSKLGGIDFQEALGAVGSGFATGKYDQHKQKRKQEFEEEGRIRDMAHDSAMKLKDFTPEVIQKFPKLQQLSQKYQDALANDGKISAKEAQEIVIFSKMAEQDMASARGEQRNVNETQDFNREATLKQGFEAEQMGRALPGTEGAPSEMLRDVGQTALDEQRFAQIPQLQSVDLGGQQRQIPMTPKEQFALAKEEERARRAEEAEARREAAAERTAQKQADQSARAERGLNMRESAADFRDAIREWEDAKKSAIAELAAEAGGEKFIDPVARKAVNDQFAATRPRRGGREAIAAPPKPTTPLAAPSGRFKIKNVQ